MQVLLGAVGVTVEQIDRMRQALTEMGATEVDELVAGDGAFLAITRPLTGVTGQAADGARSLGVIGSAVPMLERSGRLHAELRTSGPMLAAAVPELAAIRVDVNSGSFIAAAGPGNQGLFVAEPHDGGTVVGSNLALVARSVGVARQIDRSAEDFLLGFGFLPDDRTVHDGVRSLKGAVVAVGSEPDGDAHGTGTEPPRSVPEVSSFDQAVDVLYDLYMSAIEEQASGSTSHAVLLGGFDSALVAASLRRLGHDVATYTFGFGDPTYEQRNVDMVTSSIGSDENWVRITPEVIEAGLREFGTVFAQPGPQPHYQIHTLHACRLISEHGFSRVFTGDGCDAVFLGYPMVNTRARIVTRLERVPAPIVSAGLRGMSTHAADRYLGHVARMVRSTLTNLRLGGAVGGHLPTCYLDETALDRLRIGPPPAQDETVEQTRRRLASPVAELNRTRLAFHGNSLTGQSRIKVMGAVGSTGVSQFTPFTYPDVSRFVSSLPMGYLRPEGSSAGSSGKALLVEMARRHRLLPEMVIDMPKQSPVDSPVDGWYAGPLRPLVFEMLDSLPFNWDRSYVEEILRPRRVEDMYRRKVSLGHHAFQAIGLLVSYASFARE